MSNKPSKLSVILFHVATVGRLFRYFISPERIFMIPLLILLLISGILLLVTGGLSYVAPFIYTVF